MIKDIKLRRQFFLEKLAEHGYNQSKFAGKIDVSRAVLSNWLNSQRTPSIHKIVEMANALGVDFYDLLEIESEASSKVKGEPYTQEEWQQLYKELCDIEKRYGKKSKEIEMQKYAIGMFLPKPPNILETRNAFNFMFVRCRTCKAEFHSDGKENRCVKCGQLFGEAWAV